MFHTCLNCNSAGASYIIPRELVEFQLGWKLDLPLKGKIAQRQRKEDGDRVYLCKECLLGIIKLELLLGQILSQQSPTPVVSR